MNVFIYCETSSHQQSSVIICAIREQLFKNICDHLCYPWATIQKYLWSSVQSVSNHSRISVIICAICEQPFKNICDHLSHPWATILRATNQEYQWSSELSVSNQSFTICGHLCHPWATNPLPSVIIWAICEQPILYHLWSSEPSVSNQSSGTLKQTKFYPRSCF